MMTRAQKIRAERVRADPKKVHSRAAQKIMRTRAELKGRGGAEGSHLFEGLHFVLTGIEREARMGVSKLVEANGGSVWGDVPRPEGEDASWHSNPPIIVAGRQVGGGGDRH